MSDRIAYWCPRLNHVKVLGPVIAEQRAARRAGSPMVIAGAPPLVAEAATKPRAAGSEARLATGLLAEIGVTVVRTTAEFLAALQAGQVRAVVALGTDLPAHVLRDVVAPSRRDGVVWCALPHVQEELLPLLRTRDLRCLAHWDVVTTFSRASIECVARTLRAAGVADLTGLDRITPIGYPELDAVASLDRRAIRSTYGLPSDQRVIYFSTAPRFDREWREALEWLRRRGVESRVWPRWRNVVFQCRQAAFFAAAGTPNLGRRLILAHLPSYEAILIRLRRFADRHRAVIVAKTRDKHRDPSYVSRFVDRLVGDDGAFYPFRTLELMVAADLYVGLPSASAIEAAFVGLRSVHLHPFPSALIERDFVLPLRREFYFGPAGVWDAPGLATSYWLHRRQDWDAFLEWTDAAPWPAPADPGVRRAVVDKVLGWDDSKASSRFLDLLEAACARRTADRGLDQ